MPPARCSRCGINSYAGEITVSVRQDHQNGVKAYSLCGYCLPIVSDHLVGYIESNLLMEESVSANEG